MPGISVIIAVYNGIATIEKCMTSVLQQDYPSVEIIVIDDGSTDGTSEYLDHFQTEENIQIFHIPNGGQGAARNRGLKEATGDYVMFIDADDALEPGALRGLMEAGETHDIICGSYYRIENGVRTPVGNEYTEGEVKKDGTADEKQRYESIKTSSLFGYLWNKLYKKSFLDENGLFFEDVKTVYMEDTLFNLKAWAKKPSYYLCQVWVYNYYIQDNSTTHTADTEISHRYVNLTRSYVNDLKDNDVLDENMDLVVPLVMRIFSWAMVKNIPYEKMTLQRYRYYMEPFCKSEDFMYVMRRKDFHKALRTIPSFLQKVFYGFLHFCLNRNLGVLIALVFWIFKPLMMLYIKKTVK
ncbi:MAG: glycosyltransferase [Lachnospiraceae bacterium]|nr:glycosyltransferase [Lachnospiraceae bacterium]